MTTRPDDDPRGIRAGKAGRGVSRGHHDRWGEIDAKRLDLGVRAVMGLVAAGWTLARAADAGGGVWVSAVEYHGRPIVSDHPAAGRRVWIGGVSLDEVLDVIGAFPDRPVLRLNGEERAG